MDTVETSQPADHGLPGHLWTVKQRKRWAAQVRGVTASRNRLRQVLRQANLTWKKVKKLLGKAKPAKRAAHSVQRRELFAAACRGEVLRRYVAAVHLHRALDLGYPWGRNGQRVGRTSDCPKVSDRLNAYGAYDVTTGEGFLWQDAWGDGERPMRFLEAVIRWRAGKAGRIVGIWDGAPD